MHDVTTRTDAARKIVGLPHQGAYPEIGQAYEKFAILCGSRNLWPANWANDGYVL